MTFEAMSMSGKGTSCGSGEKGASMQQQQQQQLKIDSSNDRDILPCLKVFSADSIISAEIDRAGMLRVVSDAGVLFEWPLSLRTVQALAVAPDGTEVAVRDTSGQVLVWPVLDDAGSLLVLLNRFVPLGAVSANEDDNTLAIAENSITRRLLPSDDRELLDQLANGTIGQKPPTGPR